MGADDSDKAEFREAVESVVRDYVVASDLCAMPVIEDWVIVVTINDLDDDDNGKWLYMRGDKQAVHRTLGLLEICRDELLAPVDD
jgi:hypothetical protein